MFLEVNDFSAFIMIYKLRSITKAAKILNKSSATLSYLLKKIETQFARKLFERNHKELLPNVHADEFMPVAVRICSILHLTFKLLTDEHNLSLDEFKKKVSASAEMMIAELDTIEDTELVSAITSPLRIGQLIKVNVLSKNRSVAATARELKISQPSLHIQLKELETILKLPLFISEQKSTSLTEIGNLLNESAKLVMEQITSLDGFAKSQYYHVSSALKFGTVPVSGTQSKLTKILTNFIYLWKQNYSAPLEIVTDPAELLVQKLEDNAIDAAVIDAEEKESFLEYRKILDDELFLVISKDPDEEETFQSLISKYPLVLLSKGTGIRKSIDSSFAKAKIAIDPDMTINSIPLIINLVKEKKRSTILPKSAFGRNIKSFHLFKLPIPITRNIHLVYRSENKSSLSIQRLVSCFGLKVI